MARNLKKKITTSLPMRKLPHQTRYMSKLLSKRKIEGHSLVLPFDPSDALLAGSTSERSLNKQVKIE